MLDKGIIYEESPSDSPEYSRSRDTNNDIDSIYIHQNSLLDEFLPSARKKKESIKTKPPSSSTPISTDNNQYIIHEITRVDTLEGLALRYGTTVRK